MFNSAHSGRRLRGFLAGKSRKARGPSRDQVANESNPATPFCFKARTEYLYSSIIPKAIIEHQIIKDPKLNSNFKTISNQLVESREYCCRAPKHLAVKASTTQIWSMRIATNRHSLSPRLRIRIQISLRGSIGRHRSALVNRLVFRKVLASQPTEWYRLATRLSAGS